MASEKIETSADRVESASQHASYVEGNMDRAIATSTQKARTRRANGNTNNAKHTHRRGWGSLSYTARVTLSFALIAAMTVLVAIGVVSLVWSQYFQTYTRDNIQAVADTTATQIAQRYEQAGGQFTEYVLEPAESIVAVSSDVGMQVVSDDELVLFDSTTYNSDGEGISVPSLAPTPGPNNIARASILVGDRSVGIVRVWVYGSDTLLRSTDIVFRDQSYQALLRAAIIAIALASLLGYLFAHNLVRPIQRMTQTAEAIKKGNLAARTGMVGDDEISQLGMTFDDMAESVARDRKLERRLTTDVAHELRTPLMAVQATVEAMVDGVFPADEEHLNIVNTEVQRLSRLVDSLLKLSRLETRPMNLEKLDLSELVSSIAMTHKAFAEEAGLKLEFEASEGVFVDGDADMIKQATANLISNAVRYTPEGGHISVSVREEDLMAAIAVEDTGIGLTPEEVKMVFSRFWRAESGRSFSNGGLGVGLSVVKQVVDRHEGYVQVEGEKGKGSCFTIWLPIYDETHHQERSDARLRTERREGSSAWE